MRRSFLIPMLVAAILGALTTAPGPARASRRYVAIVRDGFYAGMDAHSELVYFHVAHHRVYHLRFSLTLGCHNTDTHEDYPRTFDAGHVMPQGRVIPRNGIPVPASP